MRPPIFGNADFAALFLDGSQRDLLAPKNLTQGFAIVGDAFADDDLVQSVAAFENVSRHSCELQSVLYLLTCRSSANRSGLGIRARVLFAAVAGIESRTAIDQFSQFVDVRRTLQRSVQA